MERTEETRKTDIPVAMYYGYTVFTTLCWPLSDALLALHLQRLRHDAGFLGIPFPFGDAQIRSLLAERFSQPVVARITVIPEISGFADLTRTLETSRLEISGRPVPDAAQAPLTVKSVDYEKRFPAVKHGALAEPLLLKRQALQQGADEVVWVNRYGRITEATTANVFFIREGILYTPDPENDGCLPGITRHEILAWAKRKGVDVKIAAFSRNEAAGMDGMFLTNAVFGLCEVARLDDIRFPWPDSARNLAGWAAQGVAYTHAGH